MENEEKKVAQETVNNEPKIVKGKSKTKMITISVLLAVLALVIAGFVYYFAVLTNPSNIYKKLVKNVIDETFTSSVPIAESDEKISADIGLDVTLDMEQKELQEQALVKLINSIDLGINAQIDNETEQMVLNLAATYDKEKMLDVAMFMDTRNSKAYLYAKDLLDQYLEFDMVTEEVSEENTSELALTLVSEAKVKTIITKEFANIITKDMCFRENSAYVLKTTNLVLMANIKTALENLKANEEFLECFEDPQTIVATLNEIIEIYSTEEVEPCTIEVRLYLDLFLNLEKMALNVKGETSYDLVVVPQGSDICFVVSQDGEKTSDGKISITEKDNGGRIEIDVNVEELGNINVKFDTSYEEVENIEKIDTTKVKKFEELSMLELMTLMSKLEESKLGEVITEISALMTPADDYEYEDGYYYDYEYDTDVIF